MANNEYSLFQIGWGNKTDVNNSTAVVGRLYVATDTRELFFTPKGTHSTEKLKIGDIIEVESLDDVLAPISNKFYYMENTLYRNINGEWLPVGSDIFVTIEQYEKDEKVVAASLNDLNDRVAALEDKEIDIQFGDSPTVTFEKAEDGLYYANVILSNNSEGYLEVDENGGLKVTGLDDKFEVIAAALNDLNERVDNINANISEESEDFLVKKDDGLAVVGLDEKFEVIAASLNDLNERINNVSVDVSAKDEGYLSKESDGLAVTGLDERFEVIASALNDLNERVDNISVDIDPTTEEYLTKTDEGLKISGLDEKFEVIAASLNDLNERVNNFKVELDENCENYLTVTADGKLKLTGIDRLYELIGDVERVLDGLITSQQS